ncbi:PrsW family intramembrane metalloprotease [Pseudonocardia lacus]|uniref:PrsW family intramembrane metalloprotease n=1 Tax=Pseudonocardia lacus TaxID=2835865 RepID=UPI001BDDB0CE|nr:PrsW family intramembrane metalloprotease [Pseudonocardia lacus]
MSPPPAPGSLPTARQRRNRVLGPVVVLVALGICGLTVLGLVAGSIGTSGVLVGAVCALLPVGPVVAAFLWVDRWEPEPPRLLLFAFGWGACVAALTALLVNTSAISLLEQTLGQDTGALAGPALVGPFVEEAVKGAFLVGLLVLHGREFDGVVDGVVYAGIVAAGFAFTENILYFGQAFVTDGFGGATGGVLVTFLLRGVFAPFAHPLYTAMIGIGAGLAAGSRNPGFRIGAVVVGYLVAVLLHAVWNGAATLFGGTAFFDVYSYVMVPVFLALIGLVFWQRRREQATLAEHLPEFARQGWVAPSEVRLMASMAGRREWRRKVGARSGRAAAKAVADYQAAVTELAFLQARIARGTAGADADQWRRQALTDVYQARRRAVGRADEAAR